MVNDLKAELRAVFAAILPELSPGPAVARAIALSEHALCVGARRFAPAQVGRISVIAIGKAAAPMFAAAWQTLAGWPRKHGVIVAPTAVAAPPGEVVVCVGDHPEPDVQSRAAGAAIWGALAARRADDLVIWLLSGGGSSLCELPPDVTPAIDVAATRAFHRVLVGSGLDIVRMNAVRKHASKLKGGRLALHALPAAQVSLLVSDVPAGHPDAVASGPTMPDSTTLAEARAALDQAELWPKLPSAYATLLRGPQSETPKPGDPRLAACSAEVLLDSEVALTKAERECRARGFVTAIDRSVDDAPLANAGHRLLGQLDALAAANPGRRVAVLTAGELSCPVTAPGVGGRNQQFALWCALRCAGQPVAVLSAGTDGRDGNSPAAGAVADGQTVARAAAAGLDAAAKLQGCDAFALFEPLGDTIHTGPTGTNLRDLRILAR